MSIAIIKDRVDLLIRAFVLSLSFFNQNHDLKVKPYLECTRVLTHLRRISINYFEPPDNIILKNGKSKSKAFNKNKWYTSDLLHLQTSFQLKCILISKDMAVEN